MMSHMSQKSTSADGREHTEPSPVDARGGAVMEAHGTAKVPPLYHFAHSLKIHSRSTSGALPRTCNRSSHPELRSWERAVKSCAGANGFARRMLLGTPFEGHSSPAAPVM